MFPTAMTANEVPTLLVIDDDRRIVELLTLYLEGRGYRVLSAYTFGEARSLLVDQPCALVLSDLRLGGDDGVIELQRLADDGLLPPTLVLSGHLDEASARRLGALGPLRGLVNKPFQLADLEARVDTVLGEVGP